MFIFLLFMIVDCNGDRVIVDIGIVSREKNIYVYWFEG